MKKDQLIQTLSDIGEQGVPKTVDLWPAIRLHITARPHRFFSLLPRFISVAMIGIILVGVAISLIKPQPISAQEILNRAAQAATESFGLHTYHGVMDGYYHDVEKHYWNFSRTKIWKNLQGDFRLEQYLLAEVYNTDETPNPNQINSKEVLGNTMIKHSNELWVYNPIGTPTLMHQAVTEDMQTALDMFGGFRNLESVIKSVNGSYGQIEVTGKEVVLDRPCYILTMIPDAKALWNGVLNPARTVLWIDQETFMLMRMEHQDAQQNIISAWAYTMLDPNPEIDPALFEEATIKELANNLERVSTITPTAIPNH